MNVNKGEYKMDKHKGSRLDNEIGSDKHMEYNNSCISQGKLMYNDNKGDSPHGTNKEYEPLINSAIGDVRKMCTTDPIPSLKAPISPTTERWFHILEEKCKAHVAFSRRSHIQQWVD